MFKLPLLQPHLTGSNGVVESKHGSLSRYSPFFSNSRSQRGNSSNGSTGGVDVKDWQAQAADVMAEVVNSDKYKSLALQAEVKLAEALERCGRLCVPSQTSSGEERPNKLRTAVCCQLLGEFGEMCGPFSGVLRHIRDELVRSVYSDIYTTELGTLSFDQLPWFTVAERLETEKRVMLAERERFTEMLHAHQETLARIEEQMLTYQRATQSAQLEAAQLRARLESLVASEEQARTEARTGREELKRLRKEWLRMRDELELERDAHRRLKECTDQEDMSLKAQAAVLSDAVRRAEAELEEARAQLATRLPAESVASLQQSLAQLQAAAVESQNKIQSLEEALAAAQDTMGTMTPRPAWASLRKYGIEEAAHHRTQDVVTAVSEKLEKLAAAARKAVELEQVLGMEDPAPAEVNLTIITDASSYFLTEAGSNTTGAVSAEALGRGPHVPRCLRRCAGDVITGLPQLSQEQTEAQIMHIWQEKKTHDLVYGPEHLQTYLYHYLRQQCATDLEHSTSRTATETDPGAVHHAVTQRAYALYHACSCHSRSSPVVSLFRQVLSGQLPESAFQQQQQVFACLLYAAEQAAIQPAAVAVADAGAASNEEAEQPLSEPATSDKQVPTAAVVDALQKLFHEMPSYKVSRLQETYRQSVGEAEVKLSELQALLLPLCCTVNLDAQSSMLQQHMQIVADCIAADELEISSSEEETGGKGSPHPIPSASHPHEPAKSHVQPAHPTTSHAPISYTPPACLSNDFVLVLLQTLLEQQQASIQELEDKVTQAAVSVADTTADPASSDAHSHGKIKDVQRQILGGHITPPALVQALQAAGFSDSQAHEMCASVSGFGPVPTCSPDKQPLLQDVMSWCAEKCWAGLSLSIIKSQHSSSRASFPDMFTMLTCST